MLFLCSRGADTKSGDTSPLSWSVRETPRGGWLATEAGSRAVVCAGRCGGGAVAVTRPEVSGAVVVFSDRPHGPQRANCQGRERAEE